MSSNVGLLGLLRLSYRRRLEADYPVLNPDTEYLNCEEPPIPRSILHTYVHIYIYKQHVYKGL